MRQLPISLVVYTCAKGHHKRGAADLRLTLNHWDKQVPLGSCNLIGHVKHVPGHEETGREMVAELRGRGFHVIESVGVWERGLSMGASYLGDMVTVSKCAKVYEQPYYLHIEDDSPVISHKHSLEDLLLRSCQMLERDHEMVSVRPMRRHDARGPESAPKDRSDLFWSADYNLQPALMRSRDWYRVGMVLEGNPVPCREVQCELLLRSIMDHFSRSPRKHAVWEPDVAEALHIGVPQEEHEKLVKIHNLT